MCAQSKDYVKQVKAPRREASGENSLAHTLILDFEPLEL